MRRVFVCFFVFFVFFVVASPACLCAASVVAHGCWANRIGAP